MPSTAWKVPTVAANNSGAGAVAWSNPSNALTDDTNAATAALSSGSTTSQRLLLTDFDFSEIGNSDAIVGIEVRFRRKSSGSTITDIALNIWSGGTFIGTSQHDASTAWPTTAAMRTYGADDNAWGTSLVGSQVKAAGFGYLIRAQRTAGTVTASVEYGEMRLHYATGIQRPRVSQAYLENIRTRQIGARVSQTYLENIRTRQIGARVSQVYLENIRTMTAESEPPSPAGIDNLFIISG